MFDARDGFFHFVFANQDDDYYTSTYLKLKFLPYLRYQLWTANYRYIYIFGREQQKGMEDYWVQTVGNLSRLSIETEQKKGWLSLRRKQREETELDYETEQIGLSKEHAMKCFLRVLELAKQKSSVAIVMPIEVFSDFSEEGETMKCLESLQGKKNNTNILVITTSVKEVDNNIFFENGKLKFSSNDSYIENTGVFYKKSLFPEIEKAFFTDKETTPKAVRTYNVLKSALGNRMQIWNSLTYEELQLIIRYYFMRNKNYCDYRKIDGYAAVFWTWYHNVEFREKYYDSDIDENPYRYRTVIVAALCKKDVLQKIDEIMSKEKFVGKSSVLAHYCMNMTNLHIIKKDEELDIMVVMRQFLGLVREHLGVLSENEYKELLYIISDLEQPIYLSRYNDQIPTFTKFQSMETKNLINKVFIHLREKTEWNYWDNSAMYILFLIFKTCDNELNKMCDEDSYNLLCDEKYEKGMEAIAFCLRNSITDSSEKICPSIDGILVMFEYDDVRKVQKYIIR